MSEIAQFLDNSLPQNSQSAAVQALEGEIRNLDLRQSLCFAEMRNLSELTKRFYDEDDPGKKVFVVVGWSQFQNARAKAKRFSVSTCEWTRIAVARTPLSAVLQVFGDFKKSDEYETKISNGQEWRTLDNEPPNLREWASDPTAMSFAEDDGETIETHIISIVMEVSKA